VAVQTLRQRDRGVRGLAGPGAIAASPDQKILYVASGRSNAIRILSSDATPMGEVAVQSPPSAIAVSSDGASVLVGSSDPGPIRQFERHHASGSLVSSKKIAGAFDAVQQIAWWSAANGFAVIDSSQLSLLVSGTKTESVPFAKAASIHVTDTSVWAVSAERLAEFDPTLAQNANFDATVHSGISGARDVATVNDHIYVVGSQGLKFFLREGSALTPHLSTSSPQPYGRVANWDGDDNADLDAVVVSPDGTRVFATAYFGGYVFSWDRRPATGTLDNATQIAFQPEFTDDHFDEDLKGRVVGRDPRAALRLSSLQFSGDDRLVMSSAQWDVVAVFDWNGEVLTTRGHVQEGQGGITNLGGAYAVSVSGDDRHVYAASWNSPYPAGFERDEDTGELRPLPAPAEVKAAPVDYGLTEIVVTDDGKQVIAVDDAFNQVHTYDRDSDTGVLTYRDSVGEQAEIELMVSVTVSPDGQSVYAGGFMSNSLAHFVRNPESGEVTFSTVYVDDVDGMDGLGGLEDIVVSPDGKQVYVASFFDAGVGQFTRNEDGSLSYSGVLQEGSGEEGLLWGVEDLAITKDGKQLVAASPVTNTLVLLDRSEMGQLTVADSTKFLLDSEWGLVKSPVHPGSARVALGPDSNDVYVSFRQWDAVGIFSRAAGKLTFVTNTKMGGEQPLAALDWPNGLAVTNDGRHLYVAGMLGDGVTAFSRGANPSGQSDGCSGICP